MSNRQLAISPGPHRFALLVAAATFCLIVAGALVTSHDAGLATADWPLTEGHFLPKAESLGINSGVNMVGNLFWEHGHRMVATTVGMLTIVLVIYLFVKEPRRWVRRLGIFALLAVIAQGLLGGLTVKLMLRFGISEAHATLAQLFFCTTVSLAVFTSRSWIEARPTLEEKGIPTRYLCVAALVTIFLQLILGATLRHSATWDQPLPTELVLGHIGGAIAVITILSVASLTVLRRFPKVKFLTRPATIALALLGLQLLLGVAAYLVRLKSPDDPQPLNPMVGITVAHVACGALVFATTIVLTLRVFRVVKVTAPAFELARSTAASR
ncbi:MAG TPA: COX15/CtaA family protein [Pyrinomonadaceae bacterium]|nr:COX15/CtaA family protein [Pyrinomonadaceae bacterium]